MTNNISKKREKKAIFCFVTISNTMKLCIIICLLLKLSIIVQMLLNKSRNSPFTIALTFNINDKIERWRLIHKTVTKCICGRSFQNILEFRRIDFIQRFRTEMFDSLKSELFKQIFLPFCHFYSQPSFQNVGLSKKVVGSFPILAASRHVDTVVISDKHACPCIDNNLMSKSNFFCL